MLPGFFTNTSAKDAEVAEAAPASSSPLSMVWLVLLFLLTTSASLGYRNFSYALLSCSSRSSPIISLRRTANLKSSLARSARASSSRSNCMRTSLSNIDLCPKRLSSSNSASSTALFNLLSLLWLSRCSWSSSRISASVRLSFLAKFWEYHHLSEGNSWPQIVLAKNIRLTEPHLSYWQPCGILLILLCTTLISDSEETQLI